MAHAEGIATDPVPELKREQSTQSTRHAWQGETLRLAVDAAGIALWAWNVDSDEFTMDERGFALWGIEWTERVTFEALSEHIHPADRDRVRAGFAATRAVLGLYETDFRILIDNEIRWVSARGQGQDVGIVGRTMFGVFLDVTGRKQAEEGHELLAGEMSHRVKNLLSIATALTVITSRSTSTTAEMAHELTLRLTALGRAHDLVRPLPGGQGRAALLGDLLSVLLAPYDDLGAFTGRIRVAVERMGVGEATATSLALIVHELATNALKYGSLSANTGTLDVSSTAQDGAFSIIWMERGGPPVASMPQRVGYGRKLVDRSISRQLGGSITYDWSNGGLTATLCLDRKKLKE